jgi:hypothetical protein
MADITFTAANIIPSSDAVYLYDPAVAGETLVAGDPVYLKAADSRYWKTDADASATSKVAGFAAGGAAAGQQFKLVISDSAMACGAVFVQGGVYTLSATAGKICPVADTIAAAAQYVLVVGVAQTTSTLKFNFTTQAVGILKA